MYEGQRRENTFENLICYKISGAEVIFCHGGVNLSCCLKGEVVILLHPLIPLHCLTEVAFLLGVVV